MNDTIMLNQNFELRKFEGLPFLFLSEPRSFVLFTYEYSKSLSGHSPHKRSKHEKFWMIAIVINNEKESKVKKNKHFHFGIFLWTPSIE